MTVRFEFIGAVILAAPFLFCEQALAQTPAIGTPVGVLANGPELLRLSDHKGIYFLYGKPSGKVQLSAKHRISEAHNTYVAYTQLMLWEFQKDSTPFSDVNFNPEIFHRFNLSDSATFDVAPIEHVSNGRDGVESRGVSTTFFRLNDSWDFGAMRLVGGLKVFGYWGWDPNNADIRDYAGFWSGSLAISLRSVFQWLRRKPTHI